jgi:hypothetical protein
MSDESQVNEEAVAEKTDSKLDVICALALISISVLAMIYWVSNQ